MAVMNLFASEKWRNRQRTDFGQGERVGEGEMYGKSSMESYIIICKRNSQQEFALGLRKLKQGLCINLDG